MNAPRVAAIFRVALVALLSLFIATSVQAHQLDAASLSLKEVTTGRFLMRFESASTSLQQQLDTPAIFPKACHLDGEYLDCGPSGLVGKIEFPWLEGSLTRFIVEIEWTSGARIMRIVTPSAPTLTVYGVPSSGLRSLTPIVSDYLGLGVEHILTGFDHLLFVIALALLVGRRGPLIITITAFTAAHSITLASTALGLISVPTAPVEAVIALSIVLVCSECLNPDRSLTRRAPWIVAFTFGLLHGLGFASALMEIGLPEQHVPAALLCFNIGVELGQLAVIGALFAVRALVTRANLARPWAFRALVYVIGSVAGFWSIDRVRAVFGG